LKTKESLIHPYAGYIFKDGDKLPIIVKKIAYKNYFKADC